MITILEAKADTTASFLQGFKPEAQDLVEKFFQAQEGRRMLDCLKSAVLSGIDIASFRTKLIGDLFEKLAGFYAISLQKKKEIILSPETTFDIYQAVNPTCSISDVYGLDCSLFGISRPDSLIFEVGQYYHHLTGVCEYTLCDPQFFDKQKLNQFNHYFHPEEVAANLGMYYPTGQDEGTQRSEKLGTLLHKKHPGIPNLPVCLASSWQIIYIMPSLDQEEKREPEICQLQIAKEGNGEKKTIELGTYYLPFTRRQFGNFMNNLFTTDEEAYPDEIRPFLLPKNLF